VNYDAPTGDVMTTKNTDDGSCYYHPGCTNDGFAEYWNYELENGAYPDFSIEGACVSPAEFYCSNSSYLEFYANGYYDQTLPQGGTMQDSIGGNVVNNSLCLTEIVAYCSNPLDVGYFSTNDVADGTKLENGSNFALDFAQCSDSAVFYCNDETYFEYYSGSNILDGAFGGIDGSNMIDNSLCDIPVDFYCDNSSMEGFYNQSNGAFNVELGIHTGNIIDDSTCGNPIDFYCNDPLFIGYYTSSANVADGQAVGNVINDIETCGLAADFHCADDNRVVGPVAHNFVFVLLPAEDAHFDENLANCGMKNALARYLDQLTHVMCRPTA